MLLLLKVDTMTRWWFIAVSLPLFDFFLSYFGSDLPLNHYFRLWSSSTEICIWYSRILLLLSFICPNCRPTYLVIFLICGNDWWNWQSENWRLLFLKYDENAQLQSQRNKKSKGLQHCLTNINFTTFKHDSDRLFNVVATVIKLSRISWPIEKMSAQI